MPRRGQRFNRLKQLLKDSKGAPSAGSDAEKYLKFLSGQTTYKLRTARLGEIKASGGRAANYGTGLRPFNIPAPTDATTTYFATFTKYSRSVVPGLKDEAGHQSLGAKTVNDAAYNPAILRISIKVGELKDQVSQILGKKYDRIDTKNATVPFGCKTAYGESEETQKKALLTAAAALPAFYTASYEPEEWNPEKATVKDVYVESST